MVGAPEGTEARGTPLTHLAAGVEFTRELITEPANILYPESFVERCRERFAGTGAEIIVLDEAEMEKLGMGSLLGVGLGSGANRAFSRSAGTAARRAPLRPHSWARA